MKKFTFSDLKPFFVLVSICLIVGAALALTNHVTKPIIEKNAEEKASATRLSVMAGAEEFVSVEISAENEVTSVFEAKTGGETIGYVITAEGKGYKTVGVTVGIDINGGIVGISVDASSETKGIGSKTAEPSFTDKFLGLSGNADSVDIISQATFSSKGVIACVNAALDVFESIRGEG